MEKLHEQLVHPRYELLPFKGKKVAEQWDKLPQEATITMTCSAKFGVERTIERCEYLSESDKNFEIIPHLAARSIESVGQLDDILERMGDVGMRSAFIVGGDAEASSEKPFNNSLELIKAIRERKTADELELGCTAYPDGHSSISRETLEQDLLKKQEYDLGYCATQLCFSPRKVEKWVRDMTTEGLYLPVEASIPGDIERKKMINIVKDIGISDSTSFLRKNFALAKQFLTPGGYSPDRMVNKLSPELENEDSPIVGFHICTFNDIERAEAWRKRTLRDKFGEDI